MKRGLIIGKFLPVHHGHIALIRFAASRCDELIVSLSSNRNDPIDADLRFEWLRGVCKDMPTVKPEFTVDDFDDENLPWPSRTFLWAEFIKRRFPTIDVIFSSEEYGPFFAANLGVPHVSFDQDRREFPVSGSQIRQHPYRFWDFIPGVVRPYFVKKICFYGPESTGKSFMCEKMARLYKTEFVPEVARELLVSNEFTAEDIIRIGKAQTDRVLTKIESANRVLFCDTDLITTQIYSEKYLNEIPPILYELEGKVKYDQYFLFDIDVPWIQDGLRDLGNQRKEMFDLFRDALIRRNIPYVLISGSFKEREEKIKGIIDDLLSA